MTIALFVSITNIRLLFVLLFSFHRTVSYLAVYFCVIFRIGKVAMSLCLNSIVHYRFCYFCLFLNDDFRSMLLHNF